MGHAATRHRLTVALLAAAALAAGLLVVVRPQPAHADQLSFVSANASWVNQATPNATAGQQANIYALGTPNKVQQSYVEFTVSGIPAGATGVTATYVGWTNSDSKSGTVQLRNVAGAFAEDTLTWNNRPPPDAGVLAQTVVAVNSQFSLPASNVTGNGTWRFALTPLAGQRQRIKMSSDEYSTPVTERPTLQVTFTPPPPTTTEPPTTTTLPETTTTTEPPTTTAPPTTLPPTTTLPPGPPLRFPRPASFASATTYHVSNAANVVNVPAGTDARIVCDEVLHKRIVVNNGRDVYLADGCEVDVNQTWPNADDQNVTGFSGQTGRVWVEGLWGHGTFANDGIKGNAGQAVWTAQNSRIGPLFGSQSGYHSDVFQPYGGFARLEIDNVTGYGEFQCLMVQIGDAISRGSNWNETDIGRLDCHDTQVPGSDTSARLLNVINNGNASSVGPLHFSYFGQEFFIEPRPSNTTTQNAGTVPLDNSIAPAVCFTITTPNSSPTQTATPIPGCLSSAPNFVMDGVVREMQQQEATPNTGWFEYVPTPGNGGNVGRNYQPPPTP